MAHLGTLPVAIVIETVYVPVTSLVYDVDVVVVVAVINDYVTHGMLDNYLGNFSLENGSS